MKEIYRYERIDRNEISEGHFKQVLEVEKSEGGRRLLQLRSNERTIY